MTAAVLGGISQAVPTVPVPVWEQMGLVVLVLAVLVPGMFFAIRWILNDQRKAQLVSQKELLKQQQDFIEKRDNQWQTFFGGLLQTNNDSLNKLAGVIERLTGRIECLEDKFDRHDATEMEFIRAAEAKRTTKPSRG